jgi:Family of unknown function (DUF6338)
MNFGVSSLFFELALIFMPGFIWMKIHTSYGAKGDSTQFDMILNTFIFGVISYAILGGIYWVFGAKLSILNVDTNSSKLLQPETFKDILLSILLSIALGIAFLYVENYKLFTRIVQKINATKTYGDEDVWDFVFNSSSSSVNFLYFRDFEQKAVYAGYVDVFSESGQLRELVLRDVIVYDFDGAEMYRMPRMYLARERENIHIEFPERT